MKRTRFNDDLRASYIETSLWCNTYAQDGDGQILPVSETTLDGLIGILDVETQVPTFADDVEVFYDECIDAVADRFGEDSAECETFHDMSADDFAHNFALTRKYHGAGFWDRGLGDLGVFLSDLSRAWGDASLEVWVDLDGEPHVDAI